MVISILLLMFIFIFLTSTHVFSGLQQVFIDGQAGRFQQVRSELQRLSDELEKQITSADITIVGSNCAAIGFYSILSQVSSDCISSTLDPEYGKKLFTAAKEAPLGQLDKAASNAKEVVDLNPNYSQAQLLLARIRMGSCKQHNQHCKEAIEIYQKAIEMDKALAVAYLDLGILYQHMGKNKKAISVWENAINQAQGHAATKLAHLMIALLCSKEEQWAQAKSHAKKAQDLGFTGFAAELLDEIQHHIPSDSISEGQESSRINEELFVAVKNGNIHKVKTLLDKGADVNARLKIGGTFLHGAALKGHVDLVELLISKGADVNAKDDKNGATPLHYAAYEGHKKVVQVLLKERANIYAKDREGDTPLDNALMGGHRDVAELIKKFASYK